MPTSRALLEPGEALINARWDPFRRARALPLPYGSNVNATLSSASLAIHDLQGQREARQAMTAGLMTVCWKNGKEKDIFL